MSLEEWVVDLKEIEPSRPDGHQVYVFGTHVMLAVIISMLSFNGDWIHWVIGTGLITPVLLILSGLFYSATRGNNWYRDVFLSRVSRILMQPEFENDRFLSFNRAHQLSFLIAGYLATPVCQFSWTIITSILVPGVVSIFTLMEFLFLLFVLIFVLFMMCWVFFTTISDRIFDRMYSDILHLIELDRRTHKPDKKDYHPNEYKY
ncbi:MAG: hypothetical protein ACFFF9_09255 [Candidatus Thorarchaeota archaeon]